MSQTKVNHVNRGDLATKFQGIWIAVSPPPCQTNLLKEKATNFVLKTKDKAKD